MNWKKFLQYMEQEKVFFDINVDFRQRVWYTCSKCKEIKWIIWDVCRKKTEEESFPAEC